MLVYAPAGCELSARATAGEETAGSRCGITPALFVV